jgi:tRNA(Ile2) C34 agmatinyltransferase TiaS
MKEFTPCPFCGGKIKLKGLMGLLFFKCQKCGATISFDNDECNKTPEKAYEYFEKRANNV